MSDKYDDEIIEEEIRDQDDDDRHDAGEILYALPQIRKAGR